MSLASSRNKVSKPRKLKSSENEQFPANSWQNRVYKKDSKGKMRIDNTRLIYEAQQLARNPDATEEQISEIINALHDQISKGESFRQDASSRTETLVSEREKMQSAVQMQLSKKEKLRREYLRIHNNNEKRNRKQKFETIGDELDYDISYQCLKLEVEQLMNDVNFLKLAFGDEEPFITVENNESIPLNENDSVANDTELCEIEEEEYEIIIEEEEEEEQQENVNAEDI